MALQVPVQTALNLGAIDGLRKVIGMRSCFRWGRNIQQEQAAPNQPICKQTKQRTFKQFTKMWHIAYTSHVLRSAEPLNLYTTMLLSSALSKRICRGVRTVAKAAAAPLLSQLSLLLLLLSWCSLMLLMTSSAGTGARKPLMNSPATYDQRCR